MSTDGQGTKRRKIAEIYNRLSRVHEPYRRQTDDGRATAYGERSLKMWLTAVNSLGSLYQNPLVESVVVNVRYLKAKFHYAIQVADLVADP